MNRQKNRIVWAVTAILVITVLLLANLAPAFANSDLQSGAAQAAAEQTAELLKARGGIPVGSGVEGLELFNQEGIAVYEQNADFPERMAASIIIAPVNALVRIMGLRDLTSLVYNLNADGTPKDNNNLSALWGANERGVLHRLYTQFARLAPFVIILVLVLSGALMMWNLTGQGQDYAKSVFTGLILSSIMLVIAVPFWEVLIRMNHAIVGWAYSQLVAEGLGGISFLGMLWNENTRSILMATIAVFAFFMVGVMNFQYAVRSVVLGILFFMTPIVAAVSILPTRRSVLSTWLTEVFSNLFLQAGHAIALMYFIMLINASASFWVVVATLLSLNTISSLIRSILGLEAQQSGTSRGLGAIGGMMGLSALVGVGRLGARMFSKGNGAAAGIKEAAAGGGDIASVSAAPASADSSMTSVTQKPVGSSSSSETLSDSTRGSYYSESPSAEGSTSTSQSGGYEGATAMASTDSGYDAGGGSIGTSRAITQMNPPPSQVAEKKSSTSKPCNFKVTKETAKNVAKKIGGASLKAGGAIALGAAGGLAAGAMGQSPMVGVGLGAMAGYKTGSHTGKMAGKAHDQSKSVAGFVTTAKNSGETTYTGMLKSATKQKLEKSGYYHDAVKYSPDRMAQVGQNIGGKPGAIVGEWVGNMHANRANKKTPAGESVMEKNDSNEAAKSFASIKMEQAQTIIHERQEEMIQQLPIQKQHWETEKSQMKVMELQKGKDSSEYKKAAERERQAHLAYEKTNLRYSKSKIHQTRMSSREIAATQLDRHMQAYLNKKNNGTAHHGFA